MLVHIPFVLSLRARSQKTLFKSFLGHFLSLHCGYSINFRLICFCFSPFTLILLLLCVCVRVRVRARFQRSESQCAGEKCPASLWLILCFRSCVSLTFFFWFLFPCFFTLSFPALCTFLFVLPCLPPRVFWECLPGETSCSFSSCRPPSSGSPVYPTVFMAFGLFPEFCNHKQCGNE